jgi:hypothetical protein
MTEIVIVRENYNNIKNHKLKSNVENAIKGTPTE